MNNLFKFTTSFATLFFFITSLILNIPPCFAENGFSLPDPGTIITTTKSFRPLLFKGISVDPDNALKFEILIDQGDSSFNETSLQKHATKLFKYFLAALTTSEKDIWVNLSPFEENRIITKDFGNTLMGRDMLAQDYMLKQLTSSIMFSDEDLSQNFWDTVYERMYELYGHTNLDVSTFNKVWIVPEKAVIYEDGLKAVVLNSQLKVLLEEDYVAFNDRITAPDESNGMHQEAARILKEIIIPAIENEVNKGETFSNLRQIYHALILASWYKQRMKDSLIAKIYADQNKTIGIDTIDKDVIDKIYGQYVDGFNQGVYNFIREDYDPVNQQIVPRKYVSGGVGLFNPMKQTVKNGVKKFGAFLSTILVILTATTLSTSSDASAEAFQEFTGGKLYKAELALTEVGPNYLNTQAVAAEDGINAQVNQWVRSQLDKQKFAQGNTPDSLFQSGITDKFTRSSEQILADLETNNSLNDLTHQFNKRHKNPLASSNPSLSQTFGKTQNTLLQWNNNSYPFNDPFLSSTARQFPISMQVSAAANQPRYEVESDPNLLMSLDNGFSTYRLSGSVNRQEAISDANNIFLAAIAATNGMNFSPYKNMPEISRFPDKGKDVNKYLASIQDITAASAFSWDDINGSATRNANNSEPKDLFKKFQKERYSSIVGNYTPIVGIEETPLGRLFTAGATFRDQNDFYSTNLLMGANSIFGLNLRTDTIDWNNFQLSTYGKGWIRNGEPGYQVGMNIRSRILENSAILFSSSYVYDKSNYDNKSPNPENHNLSGYYVYVGFEFRFGLPKDSRKRPNFGLPKTTQSFLKTIKRRVERENERFEARMDGDNALATRPKTDDALNNNVGGIDFNPELLDLQIKRNKNWIPLPLNQQPLESIRVEGLIPVIINVVPINSIPEFMGSAIEPTSSKQES